MQKDLIERHAVSVPRYTSYPTAPHFSPLVGDSTYREWLESVPAGIGASLYVHIPFCDRLCWFCGCTTKQVRRYDPVAAYLAVLEREIRMVGDLTDGRPLVTALHFGGGSPTMLKPGDLVRLNDILRASFNFASDAGISVEIDPNDMTPDSYEVLAQIGMTRASIGVQDFDPVVQRAINREQTFEQTRSVVDGVRAHGARSVNLDVLYGLPHQTRESVDATVVQSLELDPDRVALFGYAHVPWMKKHQRMIDESFLPGAIERFAQMTSAADVLKAAGYEAIGIDHFARPDDKLAVAAREGRLRRNFQGYTDDAAPVLIGLGASSIGELPQGYVQNSPATGDYQRRVNAGELATVRGYALTDTDRLRRTVINRLMCDFRFSAGRLVSEFGSAANTIIEEANYLAAADTDGFFVRDGGEYTVTGRGRPFVREIASAFDAHLGKGIARHSSAV